MFIVYVFLLASNWTVNGVVGRTSGPKSGRALHWNLNRFDSRMQGDGVCVVCVLQSLCQRSLLFAVGAFTCAHIIFAFMFALVGAAEKGCSRPAPQGVPEKSSGGAIRQRYRCIYVSRRRIWVLGEIYTYIFEMPVCPDM